MRVQRIAVPLLISLVSLGCGGDLEQDEPDDMIGSSPLAQEEGGEFSEPVNIEVESSSNGESTEAFYSMHNHYLYNKSASVSYWRIHADPVSGFPDGSACAPVASFASMCSNIAVFVGGTVGQLAGPQTQAYCPSNFHLEYHCNVW